MNGVGKVAAIQVKMLGFRGTAAMNIGKSAELSGGGSKDGFRRRDIAQNEELNFRVGNVVMDSSVCPPIIVAVYAKISSQSRINKTVVIGL